METIQQELNDLRADLRQGMGKIAKAIKDGFSNPPTAAVVAIDPVPPNPGELTPDQRQKIAKRALAARAGAKR